MTEYEFQCPKCHRVFSELLDPHNPEQSKMWSRCKCGKQAKRIFSAVLFRVAMPNGPDDINLGLGEHFESLRQRDYYADSHNLRLVKDG